MQLKPFAHEWLGVCVDENLKVLMGVFVSFKIKKGLS
jgi:hypothetical protein